MHPSSNGTLEVFNGLLSPGPAPCSSSSPKLFRSIAKRHDDSYVTLHSGSNHVITPPKALPRAPRTPLPLNSVSTPISPSPTTTASTVTPPPSIPANCTLFRQSAPPTLLYLLYSSHKKLLTITHQTKLHTPTPHSITLTTHPHPPLTFLTPTPQQHEKWRTAFNDACTDCILTHTLATVLTLFTLSTTLRHVAVNHGTNHPLFKSMQRLYEYMVRVRNFYEFIQSKDPGMHKGSLRDSGELKALVDDGEKHGRVGQFKEFNLVKKYLEGVDFGTRDRADDLARGCRDLKRQLETLSQSMGSMAGGSDTESDTESVTESDGKDKGEGKCENEDCEDAAAAPPAAEQPTPIAVAVVASPLLGYSNRALVLLCVATVLTTLCVTVGGAYAAYMVGSTCALREREFSVNEEEKGWEWACGRGGGNVEGLGVRVFEDLEGEFKEMLREEARVEREARLEREARAEKGLKGRVVGFFKFFKQKGEDDFKAWEAVEEEVVYVSM